MALVICNAGKIELLTDMLTTAGQTLTLHLFNNNITPTVNSSAGDFTETSFSGYSAFSLSPSSWTTPTIVSDSAQSQYASGLSWSCGVSGDTIYGAYILDTDDNLVWAEVFSSPRTLANGDVLNYTPIFTLT